MHLLRGRRLDNREIIKQLMSKDLDDLYILLATNSRTDKALMYSQSYFIKVGKRVFDQIELKLHDVVCKEWEYCEKRNNPELQDNITLVAAVTDAIASVVIGFPPILIATILVKKGLNNFCDC